MAYLFAVEEPNTMLEEPIIFMIFTVSILILVSELILRFDFLSFRMVKKYSENQYLVRRLIRSFYLTASINSVMFASDFAQTGTVILIIYYIATTPLKFRFKQYTNQ